MIGKNDPETITLIGYGKLARSLHLVLGEKVSCIISRNPLKTASSITLSPVPIVTDTLPNGVAGHPVLFWIATPDNTIAHTVTQICERFGSLEGVTVIHSSGTLPVSVLDPARQLGAKTAALHPNASLNGTEPFPKAVVWSFASDDISEEWVRDFLSPLRPRIVRIPDDARPLYHAAASIAANYSMILFHIARDLYIASGLEADIAADVVATFIRKSTNRSLETGVEDGMTGPIARGDIAVITAQLAAIREAMPEYYAWFVETGMVTAGLIGGREGEEVLKVLARAAKETGTS